MFQFSSVIMPLPLMTYNSKLGDKAPMDGKLLLKMICSEYATPASSGWLKLVTTVKAVCMLGLMELTAVLLMVRGLGLVADAVLRLMQDVDVIELLRSVQVKGVMVFEKIGKTIIM